ncbi:hypothetical protein AJ78_07799 [Emergomyces pasteurianus Ep9510]|uniref:Uncharacterized protein n=1 Tax=Emergomyces pasteurianus Ep9510 TaxID=1447872 RepID=A0A1J9P6C2_9EURO|nr:hypothetical protein AJ78_07799 [Emergomyces pasteurianus Ep9510]
MAIVKLLFTDERISHSLAQCPDFRFILMPAHAKPGKVGCQIIPHLLAKGKGIAKIFEQTGANSIRLIPQASPQGYQNYQNSQRAKRVLISALSEQTDLVKKYKQKKLREFMDMECLHMSRKGEPAKSW